MYNNITIPYHKQTVAEKLSKTFEKFAGVSITPTILINHIKKLAGKDSVISLARSDDVDTNTLNVTAYYDPNADEDNEKPFELAIIFNTNDKSVKMSQKEWRDFAAEVIQSLKHEMIHQAQYRNRNYIAQRTYISKIKDPEIKRSQEYLGNPDEIEAHAYDLAHVLIRKSNNNYDQVVRLLRNFAKTAMTKDQAGRFLSPTLFAYFKDFGFDTTHPVLKSLMKKTYQYVNQLKRKDERQSRIDSRNYEITKATEEFVKKQEALDKVPGSTYTASVT